MFVGAWVGMGAGLLGRVKLGVLLPSLLGPGPFGPLFLLLLGGAFGAGPFLG